MTPSERARQDSHGGRRIADVVTPADAERIMRRRVSPALLAHCSGVAAAATGLARHWGTSPVAAEVAGWLHDYCKELSGSELLADARRLGVPVGPLEERRPVSLLHAPVAAAELERQGVSAECCEAVRRHTVGGAGMNTLERCVYVADAIEPARSYEGVDQLRRLARESLTEAVVWSARRTLGRLVERGRPVHPDTLALYNESCL